ncbi:AMP-binding protein, partial (plasmid) [Rhizobium rhizogenes]
MPQGTPLLSLDDPAVVRALDQEPDSNPEDNERSTPLTLFHPAYVIYTSGSTGRPKGVVATHYSVGRYLRFIISSHRLESEDTVLNIVTIAFDPSIRDIFAPLLCGARFVLISGDARASTSYLEAVVKHRVSKILSVTPSFLEVIALAAIESCLAFPRVCQISSCGEALSFAVSRQAAKAFPNAVLINQYGPTECTMTSMWFRLNEAWEGTAPL